MNEQIKELARQAEFSEKDLHIQGDNFQMFAELIIKKCIKLCDMVDLVGADDCIDNIKEHFGLTDKDSVI